MISYLFKYILLIINMKFYWCRTLDETHTNFGDILTPYILHKYGIPCTFDQQPDYVGIGSLLHVLPNEAATIWTSGFMYPTHVIKNPCLAVRGKLSLSFCENASPDTPLGDGGLLLSRVYRPLNEKKYILGIVVHYSEIKDFHFMTFPICQDSNVLLINPYGTVEETVDKINQCCFIVSSSLHGLIVADTFQIPNALFCTRFTHEYIHKRQSSFKYRDYYSVWNQDFTLDDIYMITEQTTLIDCIEQCKRWYKEKSLQPILDGLEKTILLLKSRCLKPLNT